MAPAIFDRDVLVFDVTGFTKSPVKGRQKMRGRAGRTGEKIADHGHRLPLCVGRERQDRCIAEPRDERAAPHSITLSATHVVPGKSLKKFCSRMPAPRAMDPCYRLAGPAGRVESPTDERFQRAEMRRGYHSCSIALRDVSALARGQMGRSEIRRSCFRQGNRFRLTRRVP